jgi:hypothetical protein
MPRDVKPESLESFDGGRKTTSVVFSMAFYSELPFTAMATSTLDAFERFKAIAGQGALNYYITDTMNKHRAVTPKALDMLATWLRPGAPKRDSVAIAYQASEVFNSAPSWFFIVNGREVNRITASVIRLGFPAQYGVAQFDDMAALFSQLCQTLPIRSGRAGFAVFCSRYDLGVAQEHAVAKSMRHPGLDIVDENNEAIDIRWDAILGSDWLTYIDAPFVTQLGGAPTIEKAAAANGVPVTVLPGGLVLRAGDRPAFGDVNRGDDLPKYKAVYRIVRPLMDAAFARAHSLGIQEDLNERTLDWLKRHER